VEILVVLILVVPLVELMGKRLRPRRNLNKFAKASLFKDAKDSSFKEML
jgi:hypothetical protein